jgi:polyphenol oxidase
VSIEQGETGNRLPDPGAGFIWGTDAVPLLHPVSERATAAFTTRVGGVSTDDFATLNLSFAVGDDEDLVRVNRLVASEAFGAMDPWRVVKQVHGSEVRRASPDDTIQEADAQWTEWGETTIATLSADCVLLLLTGSRRIGVAHAGWRGLIGGIVENAVGATDATEAFAGPAIGPCCFEVGPDVMEAFQKRYPAAVVDDSHVDLWTAAETAGSRAGATVRSARICTSCNPELFFSHRRDAGRTGRQALLARVSFG